MSSMSRSSNRGGQDGLPAGLNDLDRLFGNDFSSKGWVVDLARMAAAASADDDDSLLRVDEALDPAMIWVMGGRRR